MFRFIKQVFIGLLASIVNASNHTKCISLNNQQCMIQPTHINLHPNEYSQGCYYQLAVNLDRPWEVVILLMIYPIKYVFQTKQDLNRNK